MMLMPNFGHLILERNTKLPENVESDRLLTLLEPISQILQNYFS